MSLVFLFKIKNFVVKHGHSRSLADSTDADATADLSHCGPHNNKTRKNKQANIHVHTSKLTNHTHKAIDN